MNSNLQNEKSNQIIFELLKEIDWICNENNIDYFLVNSLALMAYRDHEITSDINLGRILMTADNLKRFIKVYPKYQRSDRQIEWMGNNPKFPGMYLRYIDINTFYYTPKRVITEQFLGMYINIDVLRPAGKREKYFRAIENAWRNFCYGDATNGHKWEPKIRSVIKVLCTLVSQKKVARFLFAFLSRQYSSRKFKKWCYIQKDSHVERKYYKFDLFKHIGSVTLNKNCFKCSRDLEEYLKQTYGTYGYKNVKPKLKDNGINLFCDPNFSYKIVNFDKYRNQIDETYQKYKRQHTKELKARRKKNQYINIMLQSYYRFYYAYVKFKNVNYLWDLYNSQCYEELDILLLPYLQDCLKMKNRNKSLYINEDLTTLLKKRYNVNVKTLFKQTPKSFKQGVMVYDHKNRFIELIEGKND